MGETADSDDLFWLDPDMRGVLPLAGFHLPRRLARTIRNFSGHVTINTAFDDVIHACAAPHPNRPKTWINQPIIACYQILHQRGIAHSVEVWADDVLVGGLYGVALGGAFFGESMFSRARDTSKIALSWLVGRLRVGGFSLLDTQFLTAHLGQFGACEIPRAQYRQALQTAIGQKADFLRADNPAILRNIGV